MKILLIFPPLSRTSRWINITTIMPPLGIATIAAVLEKAGYEVEVLDMNFLQRGGFSWKELEKSIRDIGPDVVGITCTTPAVISVLKISDIVKVINPKIFVVVGGPNASALPQNLLEIGESVDFVVIGEGEHTFLELLSYFKNKTEIKEVKGVGYREDGKIILTFKRPYIENLDELPFPARHFLPPLEKYHFAIHCYKSLPVTSIITSRGCSCNCNFCSQSVFGHRYRVRTPKNIVSEIEYLVREHSIRSIMIVDDTFTANKARVDEFCELLISKNLNVSWLCYAGIQEVDKVMLIKMRRAGCHQIYYGIESGIQRLLNKMNKGITIAQIKDAVKYAKDAGLEVRGQFMLGYPTETLTEVERTIKFSKGLNLDYAEFSFTTPLPGSQLYNQVVSKGNFRFQSRADFEVFQEGTSIFLDPILSLGEMNKEESEKYIKKAYRDFYFRFSYIIRYFLKIKTISDINKVFKTFFEMLFWSLNCL